MKETSGEPKVMTRERRDAEKRQWKLMNKRKVKETQKVKIKPGAQKTTTRLKQESRSKNLTLQTTRKSDREG